MSELEYRWSRIDFIIIFLILFFVENKNDGACKKSVHKNFKFYFFVLEESSFLEGVRLLI